MKKRFITILFALIIISIIAIGMFGITTNAASATEYTITYHLDGGTNALKNPDVYTSEDVITLKDATKEGYDFAGWYLDAAKTEQISEISGRTGNLNLYAKYTPKEYTATFNDNGATSSSALTITLKDSYSETTKTYSINNGDTFDPYSKWIPQRDGYAFSGWYNGSQFVTGDVEINSDTTLISQYIYCESSYYILGKDTSTINCENYKWNSTYPSSVYFYVDGSYDTINFSGDSWDNYYSSWEYYEHHFEIYDITNGRLVGSTDDGKNFETAYRTINVSPGILYHIKFYSNYDVGNVISTAKVSIGHKRSANITASNQRVYKQGYDGNINSPEVSKTGYDFIGWYDTNGNKMTDTWEYTQNKTFTAKWQATKYSLTYHLDGGTNSASNPSSFTIEDSITLKNPTKPGYTFKGWYSDSNFTTNITSFSQKSDNITLYAKWEANSYDLILDTNGGVFAPKVTFVSDGVEISSSYVYSQNKITAYRPNNKAGYIFAGWYEDASFTNLFKFNGTITEDITLYAKWIECRDNIINIEQVKNIDVSINGKTERIYAFVPLVDGTIVVTSVSDGLDLYGILYNSSKSALISADDISDNDLDFSYTYNVKAGQLYYISVKGSTSSTSGEATINVDWTGSCAITGSSSSSAQLSVVYDTEYSLSQHPVRKGYVFIGWFDENDTKVTDGIWNFTTDKTLTAKWAEATYHTVTFKNENGEIISSDTYCLLDEIIAPEFPTKSPDHIGSYISKWDNNYTGVCTGDAVYTVVFEIDEYVEYTVEFKNWNGDLISTQKYHYGDTVIPPKNPTRVHDDIYTYTFAGWDTEVLNCVGDATYTATYNANYICYSEGLEYSLNYGGKSYSVSGIGTCTETDIVIYATYNDLPVTSISYQAFDDCDSITSITIHNSVTSISRLAFYGCTSLTSIYFNGTIEQWNDISKGSDWNYNTGSYTVYCSDGTVLKLKEDIEVLKEKCLTIEAEIDYINTLIFEHSSQCDNSTCPIEQYVSDYNDTCAKFSGFKYQIDTLDAKICELENAEEIDVQKMKELNVDIEKIKTDYVGGQVIDADLAAVRSYIEDLDKQCTTSVIIPAGDTSIDNWEFGRYSVLTSITIPDSVTSIGSYAFYDCTSLTSIIFEGTVQQWQAITKGNSWDINTGVYTIYCTDGEISKDGTIECYEHLWGEWYEVIAPQCTVDGLERHDCTRCEYYETNVLEKTAHSYNVVVITPTCITNGYTTHTCEDCGDSCVDSYVDALGHAWTDATCTAPKTCSRCSATEGSSLGHNFATHTSNNDATCTVDGTKTSKCTRCTVTETVTDVNSKLGHDMSSATCTEASKCQRSGCNYTQGSALGHNYNNVVTTPTCTAGGYTTHTCHCGDSFVDAYVDAVGHTEGEWIVEKEATCTDAGSKYQNCSVCGVTLKGESTGPKGHDYTSIITDPTCTEKGYTTYTCHCGDSYVSNETEALGHSYTSEVTTKPTYTTTGIRTYTCSACGDSYTEVIPAITCEHNYRSVVTAPTCTAQGYTTYTCSVCGDTYIDNYTAKLEHSWGNSVVTTAPTCTADGVRTFTCSCSATKTEVEPATGHSYTSIATEPTCTERGYTSHTCHCGDSYINSYVDALGHNYGEWYEVTAPTCTVDGLERHDCTRCEHYETNVLENTGHTTIVDEAVESTCTSTGLTEGSHCSVCNDVFAAQTETPKKAHTYDDNYDATCNVCGYERDAECAHTNTEILPKVDATCTTSGLTEGEKCIDCNEILIEQTIIDALGHSYESVVTEPTCTEQGYTTHTCHCGDNFADSYTEALGHTWNDGEIAVEPTASSKGEMLYTCEICGEERKEDIPQLDQAPDEVGDLDGEEGISSNDAVYLLMHTFFPEEYPINQDSDFDGSGEVDSNDAVYLLMHTFFPEEYPLAQPVNVSVDVVTTRRKEDEE